MCIHNLPCLCASSHNLIHVGDTIRIPEVKDDFLLGTTPTTATRKYVEAVDFFAYAPAVIGDTTITLNEFVDIYGNDLDMDDFGSVGYGRSRFHK